MHVVEIKPRPSWDEYYVPFLEMAKQRASCPRRQTSAIIIDINKTLISVAYNGPPSGLSNCIESPCPGVDEISGKTDNCIALHAEHNAIYFAGYRRADAHTMYCTTLPCMKCALEILQTPIKRVVYVDDYGDKRCRYLFNLGGVELVKFFTL